MKLKLLTAAMLAMAIAPMQANAAVATATLQLTATVVSPTGSVAVAGPLAFGTVVLGQTASATTSFDVTVTNGVPYSIAFGAGNFLSNTSFRLTEVTGLTINGFAATSPYSLWSNSTKTTAYAPDNTNAPVITNLTGSGAAQTYPLYAETTPNVVQPAGNYADTITITVTY